MPLVCVCRGAGGCACVSTRASLGSGFWPNPDRGVTDRRDVRISSSALKLMQRAVLAWTLTSSRGVDPIPATWRWFCLERWTLRGALVLWTSEPCRRPEPPIHTLGVCEESNLLSSILEETTRHSEGLSSIPKNIPSELDEMRKTSRLRQTCVSKGSILSSSQKVVF